jgi:hypothetical protein
MNGHDLTLGHKAWATRSTSYQNEVLVVKMIFGVKEKDKYLMCLLDKSEILYMFGTNDLLCQFQCALRNYFELLAKKFLNLIIIKTHFHKKIVLHFIIEKYRDS